MTLAPAGTGLGKPGKAPETVVRAVRPLMQDLLVAMRAQSMADQHPTRVGRAAQPVATPPAVTAVALPPERRHRPPSERARHLPPGLNPPRNYRGSPDAGWMTRRRASVLAETTGAYIAWATTGRAR